MRRFLMEEIRIFTVVFKRFLTRKSFWVILCLLPFLLVGVERLGTEEDAGLRAVLYCEEDGLKESLAKQDALSFDFVDSIEELKQQVLSGTAECGYVITDDLFEAFEKDDWSWKVTVYEGPDSMFTQVISEVLFEKIYEQVSVDWYISFMKENLETAKAQSEEEIRETLKQVLLSDETFQIETIRLRGETKAGIEKAQGENIISVRDVTAVLLYLMSLLAVMDVLNDREKGHFRRQKRLSSAIWTIALPVCIIGLVSVHWIGWEIYLGMSVVIVAYALILSFFVRKTRWMYGLIPVLFIASLVCCPVFVDIGSFFPLFVWIKWLFPLGFCL